MKDAASLHSGGTPLHLFRKASLRAHRRAHLNAFDQSGLTQQPSYSLPYLNIISFNGKRTTPEVEKSTTVRSDVCFLMNVTMVPKQRDTIPFSLCNLDAFSEAVVLQQLASLNLMTYLIVLNTCDEHQKQSSRRFISEKLILLWQLTLK